MARRQGSAGVGCGRRAGGVEAPKPVPKPVLLGTGGVVRVRSRLFCLRIGGGTYVGRFRFPSSLSMKPSTSTRSRRAFGSVVLTVPASHISVSSWATTS